MATTGEDGRAAKRVEAEKRVMSARADETARAASAAVAVAAAAVGNAPTYPAFGHGGHIGDQTGEWTPPWPTKRGTKQSSQAVNGAERSRIEPEFEQQFGAYAPFAAAETARAGGATVFGANVHPLPQRVSEPQMQPYFERDVDAANSNTAPLRAPIHAVELPVADVLPFTPPSVGRPGPTYNPRSQTSVAEWAQTPAAPKYEEPATVTTAGLQQQMGIVMTRVTESITVPVSTQAQLPQALLAAGFLDRRPSSQAQEEPVFLIAHDGEQDGPSESDEWSVADSALIQKYASQPGE